MIVHLPGERQVKIFFAKEGTKSYIDDRKNLTGRESDENRMYDD